MQSKDTHAPVKGKTQPKKAAVRKTTTVSKTKAAAQPQADKPLAPAEKAAELIALQGKLQKNLEKHLRAFQAEVAAINTDAAYEVKHSIDALMLDANEGLRYFATMVVKPDYTPDEWRANVINGLQEDVPLPVFKLGDEEKQPKPKKAKGERRIKAEEIADEIVVEGEPVLARN